MRHSKRGRILAAAVDIVAADGLEGLSYETLADTAGLSKSGVIYHFPSRHELLLGVHRHLAAAWEEELEEIAGGRAEDLTAGERLRAVLLSMGRNADLPELLMILDSRHDGEYRAVWEGVDRRWMPEPSSTEAYLVQLLAYGLWAHDHVHHAPLSAEDRERLISAALARIPT
ncbi:MAG: TetR family transcriptional regulator [Corynebacterium humireducens]|uniref:TetR family transcriptional regulator n=1 Tax=Corynebacterium humireducens TaxID=1223514 RepID=A0A7X6PPR5_9CORY|nr:TetR family transcriptional regulator [Corynebacterium humireducens]